MPHPTQTTNDEIKALWDMGEARMALDGILDRLTEMEHRLDGLLHKCTCGAEISTAFELCDGCASDAQLVKDFVDAGICPVCNGRLDALGGCHVCAQEDEIDLNGEACSKCGVAWDDVTGCACDDLDATELDNLRYERSAGEGGDPGPTPLTTTACTRCGGHLLESGHCAICDAADIPF